MISLIMVAVAIAAQTQAKEEKPVTGIFDEIAKKRLEKIESRLNEIEQKSEARFNNRIKELFDKWKETVDISSVPVERIGDGEFIKAIRELRDARIADAEAKKQLKASVDNSELAAKGRWSEWREDRRKFWEKISDDRTERKEIAKETAKYRSRSLIAMAAIVISIIAAGAVLFFKLT